MRATAHVQFIFVIITTFILLFHPLIYPVLHILRHLSDSIPRSHPIHPMPTLLREPAGISKPLKLCRGKPTIKMK